MNHCWKDFREWLEENGWEQSEAWIKSYESNATCLLPDGHKGLHEWTPDSEISVMILS